MKATAALRALMVAALFAPFAVAAGPLVPVSGGTAVATSSRHMTWSPRAFSLPGLDGVTHSLADWHGQVILLNFWASSCGPCLQEIPDLVAIQDQYGPRGLRIVGVGIDDAQKLRNVARTLEINYPVLVANPDRGELLMEPLGNKSGVIPYTVAIDREGRVAFRHRGLMHRDELDELMRSLLSGERSD